jgi:hypothetical protein
MAICLATTTSAIANCRLDWTVGWVSGVDSNQVTSLLDHPQNHESSKDDRDAAVATMLDPRYGVNPGHQSPSLGNLAGVQQGLNNATPGLECLGTIGVNWTASGGGFAVPRSVRTTFGHGVRHLEGTCLTQGVVEGAISGQIQSESLQGANFNGGFWGRIQINEITIEYRALTLPDGTVNVGTYYPL